MTDTPETDAAEWGITPNDMVVRSGLARKLELERDEAVRSCHIWQKGHSEMVKERDRWIRLYDSATAERDNTLLGKLVAFDCREKMLTFEMSKMPSTGTFGESFYISQNQPK